MASDGQEKEGGSALTARLLLTRIVRSFSLRPDTDYEGTLQQVRADVEFRSGNTWALVCAILIASVGLNVNSTAVIIGAMLISPLMGPIMGAGFSLATNDFPLLRRSLNNLALAMMVGLVASTIYFALTPLAGPQSELLARTRPTLYDVLIALFGGAAGFVAVSRKNNKSSVVPGVAIATALMPPLCTAGFGLAKGDIWFFLGAFHLFLINALFICLATVGLARLMRFKRVAKLDRPRLLRARWVIALMMLAIGVPSVYTGWTVIQEARFQQAAHRFVADNLSFSDRAVVNIDLKYATDGSTISATLLGRPLPESDVRALEQRLAGYGLDHTRLVLRQPDQGQASPEQIGQMVRQGILEDLFKHNEEALHDRDTRIHVLENEVVRLHAAEFPVREVTAELATLFPTLVSLGFGHEAKVTETGPGTAPTVIVTASWRRMPSASEQERMHRFLAHRLGVDSLRLVNVVSR